MSKSPAITRQKNYTPIAQKYDGHLFRSRLEVRWAAFFNEMGVKYEYEKQGYTLPNKVRYLPDFYLPKYNLFLEIKGQPPTFEEVFKCCQLFNLTGCAVAICEGLPKYDGSESMSSMFCWVEYFKNEIIPLQTDFQFANTYEHELIFNFQLPMEAEPYPRFYASPNPKYELKDVQGKPKWDCNAVNDAVEVAKFLVFSDDTYHFH